MISTLVIGLVLAALPLSLPSFWVGLITEMLIMGIMAMSINLLLGYAGLLSLGHAGFFGTAAYVVGILSTRYEMGFWLSSLGGILGGTSLAAIFALLVAHTSGGSFLMITMALGLCLWGLSMRWVSMTGGDMGIPGISRPDIGLPLDLYNDLTFYYFTLVVFALVLWGMYIFVRSPFGQSLRGIRASESRMRVLGYNVWLHKYLGFVIAGVFASVAGVVQAWHNEFVSPYDLDLMASIKPVIMVVLGGVGTLMGPLAGSVIYIFLENFISTHMQVWWQIIMGAVLIGVVFYAPRGLVTSLKSLLKTKAVPANFLHGTRDTGKGA